LTIAAATAATKSPQKLAYNCILLPTPDRHIMDKNA